MIEILIKDYLSEMLTVPVYLEVPSDFAKNFVFFEKTGSSESNKIQSITVAFQSNGISLYEAAKLNEEVKQAVEEMINLDYVSNVRLNTDYPFNDTILKSYRYQAVFDLTLF